MKDIFKSFDSQHGHTKYEFKIDLLKLWHWLCLRSERRLEKKKNLERKLLKVKKLGEEFRGWFQSFK